MINADFCEQLGISNYELRITSYELPASLLPCCARRSKARRAS